ncbi:pyrroline-5-carboxylate reductase [Melaminivora sp.]|uniref:pyrroline-5-carboxylate reductase n=1 Tax=Melaminivora sp. TaxID=1933032 RepID=UPI0028A723FA|nr:pyrroline-5-carboxylate reductase [Melaminivora sp.]
MSSTQPTAPDFSLAFIGGGNMASALAGGLLREGLAPARVTVVEPLAAARQALQARLGVQALAAPQAALAQAQLVVWAVKPQVLREAARQALPHLAPGALHLSVAAGIPTDSLARWLGSERIVRAMPNTPALVGRGITGLFARPGVDAAARERIGQVIAPTGQHLWVQREEQLDAVTALSGSGPAYVFLFLEAMEQAGAAMGLPAAQARQLAIATFQGAAELAACSGDAPEVLRQRVTSPGGTTHAAIKRLQEGGVPGHFIAAMQAAEARARELAAEFGG